MRLVYAVLALGFALATLAAAPRPLSRGLLLAWLLVAIAFAQRMFLVETGPRASHGKLPLGILHLVEGGCHVQRSRATAGATAVETCGARRAVPVLQAFSGCLYLYRLYTGADSSVDCGPHPPE